MRLVEFDQHKSKSPALTATVAVFRKTPKGIDVLLGKRKNPPEAGSWALPGGHVNPGETSLEGALRELKEETGIDLHYLTLIAERPSVPDRGIVDVCYGAVIDADYPVKYGSDSLGSKWVNVGHLPEIAFEHSKYVYDALGKLFGLNGTIQECLTANENILSEAIKAKVQNLVSLRPQTTKGKLIVFEGMDGVGKSTQMRALKKWLEEQGHKVAVTSWNSSKVVKVATDRAKNNHVMTPLLFCLLNAADMIHRYDTEIVPELEKGHYVICDRYCYTSKARDGARGVDLKFIESIYEQFREPDIIFYCHVPVEVALKRIGSPSYYEAGLDLGLSKDPKVSFKKYQEKVDEIYRKVLPKKITHKIITTEKPKIVTTEITKILEDNLKV